MTTLRAHRSDGVIPSAIQWRRCDAGGANCNDLVGETSITHVVDDALDLSVRVVADGVTSPAWYPGVVLPPGDFYNYNGFEGDMATAVETLPWYIAYNNDYNIFDSAKWKTITPGADGSGQAVGLTVTSSQTTYGTTNLGPLVFAGVSTDMAHTVNGTTTWYSWKFKLPSAEFQTAYGEFMWFAEWHEQSPGIGASIGFGFLDYHDGNPATTRSNIQLRFRPGGGSTDAPTYEDWVAPWPSEVMQLDGWYKVVIGITWDPVASNVAGGTGQFELYITKPDNSPLVLRKNVASSNGDGVLWSNPHPFPTLYHVPLTGAIDRPAFGFYNYRRALSSGSSRIDIDDSYIGPTRTSVGG